MIYEEFLKAKKHPHPKYGCVCGVAHMGRPESVIYDFFKLKYGEHFTSKFGAGHCYVYDKYYAYIACEKCGQRVYVEWAEDWDAADAFITQHKC